MTFDMKEILEVVGMRLLGSGEISVKEGKNQAAGKVLVTVVDSDFPAKVGHVGLTPNQARWVASKLEAMAKKVEIAPAGGAKPCACGR